MGELAAGWDVHGEWRGHGRELHVERDAGERAGRVGYGIYGDGECERRVQLTGYVVDIELAGGDHGDIRDEWDHGQHNGGDQHERERGGGDCNADGERQCGDGDRDGNGDESR